ncbi:MAG TPA: sialidase family protein [Chloroflexota bacterium]|nr:sialidase family protein [Chloroflexota bacterium]
MKRSSIVLAALMAIVLLPMGSVRASGGQYVGGPLPPDPGLGIQQNQDAEPGIAVDGAGTFWIGSNDVFYDSRSEGVLSGEDVWKSTDGGQTYQWVASPFGATNNTAGPAGEDSDIAAATAPNAQGYYNVYAASLWVGSTSVAISQDGGKSWVIDPLGGIPVEDRPWIAADGACTFYVTYHQIPLFDPVVNRYDICNLSDLAAGVTINPTSSTQLFLNNSVPGLTNDFGKIWVDNSAGSRYHHYVYVPMMGCDLNGPVQIVQNEETSSGCLNKTELFIGVSTDGGRTFNDYKVAEGANGEEPVWCCNVTTDAAGTVYFVWSDNHNAYLAASSDGGQTWGAPVQLNKGGAAVYPTAAGGVAGQVKVAFYATTVAGDSNDPVAMGNPGAPGAAQWTVQVASSNNYGKGFGISTATSTVHTGVLCTEGDNCSITNSRDLYDDFGAAISPLDGHLSIAYTSDQPGGTNANDFTGYATTTK